MTPPPPVPRRPKPKRRREDLPSLTVWLVIINGLLAAMVVVAWLARIAPPLPPPPPEPPKPVVSNRKYDHSVDQVEIYVRRNIGDPDPDFLEWSDVSKTPDGGYMVRCKYRAETILGGHILMDQVFWLDSAGRVTDVQDWN